MYNTCFYRSFPDLRNLLRFGTHLIEFLASIIGQRTWEVSCGLCVWCAVFTHACYRNATLHGPSSSAPQPFLSRVNPPAVIQPSCQHRCQLPWTSDHPRFFYCYTGPTCLPPSWGWGFKLVIKRQEGNKRKSNGRGWFIFWGTYVCQINGALCIPCIV